MNDIVKKARKIIIGVIGATILLIGFALLVLPGPAFLVIPVGLGILATEFAWARHLLKKVKDKIQVNTGNHFSHKKEDDESRQGFFCRNKKTDSKKA